jgi:hypothetical protein
MRHRFASLIAVLVALALAAGCEDAVGPPAAGGDEDMLAGAPAPSPSRVPLAPGREPEADHDVDDPAYSLLADSNAADEKLVARSGRRADYRVPAAVVGRRP